MSIRRRMGGAIIIAAMAVAVAQPLTVATASSAHAAASRTIFTVMNTSETPPDGVWFRASPHTADTDRVTGHGVYAGDVVELVCYAYGEQVGPYHDALWYYSQNLTRPTVPGTTTANAGYLNAHYINDGQPANHPDSGVPVCGAPAPVIPEGASAFFIPQPSFWHNWSSTTANINDPFSTWAPGGCTYGGGVSSPYNGRWVSILGGWSNGRLGPVYYLAGSSPEQVSHVHYVLLIDPGNAKEFSQSCDSSRIGHIPVSPTLANWLALNPNNHLMILAASATGSDDGVGLTTYYLQTIQQRGLMGQVTVCWDDHLGHQAAFTKYAVNATTSLISHPSTSCPSGY